FQRGPDRNRCNSKEKDGQGKQSRKEEPKQAPPHPRHPSPERGRRQAAAKRKNCQLPYQLPRGMPDSYARVQKDRRTEGAAVIGRERSITGGGGARESHPGASRAPIRVATGEACRCHCRPHFPTGREAEELAR